METVMDEETAGLLAVAGYQLTWCLQNKGEFQRAVEVAETCLGRVERVLERENDLQVYILLVVSGQALERIGKLWLYCDFPLTG